jgi:hypothetical protein
VAGNLAISYEPRGTQGAVTGIERGGDLPLREAPQKYLSERQNPLWKAKTSITFPSDLLARLDRIDKNRSALLERAALAYLAYVERLDRDRKDIEIINRNANRLNREARDTME